MRPGIPLSARVAWRYLFSKKRHGAVGAITTISMCGVAVAAAALVIVMSVFNGFRDVIMEKDAQLGSDATIIPASGKSIAQADSIAMTIQKLPEVKMAYPVIADKALAFYEGREMPVSLLGVDEDAFANATSIRDLVCEDGRYSLSGETSEPISSTPSQWEDEEEMHILMNDNLESSIQYYALISPGVATRLSVHPVGAEYNPSQDAEFVIFAPRREGYVNIANPSSSFTMESMKVSGVFQTMQSDYDRDYVIISIPAARNLMGMEDNEASHIAVKGAPGVEPSHLADMLRHNLPENVLVKDSMQMQEANFRMINIEKWITFLLLAFILLIASFNIISALSMLVLDKEGDLSLLHALGWCKRHIGHVFGWVSIYVAGFGGIAGIATGIILSILQQHFGWIKLSGDPSTLVITAYPVKVMASDILFALIPVALIGLITAIIAQSFAKIRIFRI